MERSYLELILQQTTLKENILKEITGAEKAKLFPSDIGIVVNDFLVSHFQDILDYNFTANVEKEFDEIAMGSIAWAKMIDKFYKPFHQKVEITTETSERSVGERILGKDPNTGKPIIVRLGRFGPMAQIGESNDEEKPKFASLLKGQSIENISLEEALSLFKLPRSIGQFENMEITAGTGRFGPYLKHNGKYYSIKPTVDNPLTITLERAVTIIEEKRIELQNKIIKTYSEDPEIQVLNGRWGPYIAFKKNNFKIPKSKSAESLSSQECRDIIDKGPVKSVPAKVQSKKAQTAKAVPSKAKASRSKPTKGKPAAGKKKS